MVLADVGWSRHNNDMLVGFVHNESRLRRNWFCDWRREQKIVTGGLNSEADCDGRELNCRGR